jgi:hypothetical protein
VGLVRTDVSEEYIASIISVKGISYLTSLKTAFFIVTAVKTSNLIISG